MSKSGTVATHEGKIEIDLDDSHHPSGAAMTARVPRYVLITPARNEVAYIENVLRSVIAQTTRPVRWVIVSDGSTQPYRIRVRPPSFVNLQALDMMVRGALVSDVIAVIGTLDIVLGEVDR